jgi:hypothetical protein
MRSLSSALLAVFASLTALLALLGCQSNRGPAGPPGFSPLYLSGSIARDWYGAPIEAQILVFESPSVPSATINGLACTLTDNGQYNHFDFELSDGSFQLGDPFHIQVQCQDPESGLMLAFADLILPDSFAITSHDSDLARIPVGDALEITWSASHGADGYIIDFEFWYNYYDSTGNMNSFRMRLDSVLTDTALVFDAATLFPNLAQIDSLWPYASYNGWFEIWAQSGPWQMGDAGNVQGDGEGMINGRTFGGHLTLYVIE